MRLGPVAFLLLAASATFAPAARAQGTVMPRKSVRSELRAQVGAVGFARIVRVATDPGGRGCSAEVQVGSNVPAALEAQLRGEGAPLSVSLSAKRVVVGQAPTAIVDIAPGVQTIRVEIHGAACGDGAPVSFRLALPASAGADAD